jgi:hypothetical protein
MASARFEAILDGCKSHFEGIWADIRYTFQDIEEFLNDHPVSPFVTFTRRLTLTVDSGMRKMCSVGNTMRQTRRRGS